MHRPNTHTPIYTWADMKTIAFIGFVIGGIAGMALVSGLLD